MKKQLLLSTLAVAAIAGSLHADEEKSKEATRDCDKKKEMSVESKRSMAKVVVADAAEKEDEKDKDKKMMDAKEKGNKNKEDIKE